MQKFGIFSPNCHLSGAVISFLPLCGVLLFGPSSVGSRKPSKYLQICATCLEAFKLQENRALRRRTFFGTTIPIGMQSTNRPCGRPITKQVTLPISEWMKLSLMPVPVFPLIPRTFRCRLCVQFCGFGFGFASWAILAS